MKRNAIAVVLGVLALCYAVAVVAVLFSAPDKGFLSFAQRRVVQIDAGREAARAGLRVGDQILSVDGRELDSTLEYIDALLTRRPGESVRLGFDRDGDAREATITLRAARPPIPTVVAAVLSGVLVVLSFFVAKRRPDEEISRLFIANAAVHAIVYSAAMSWSYLLAHPLLLAGAATALFLSPPMAFEWTSRFPLDEHERTQRSRAVVWVVSATLAVATAVAVLRAVSTSGATSDGWLRWVARLITAELLLSLFVLAMGLVVQFRGLRSARHFAGGERAQLKWIVFGSSLSVVVALLAVPAAASNIDLFLVAGHRPYSVALAILFFASAHLAVFRIGLADVDVYITRSVAYVAASAAAIIGFVGVVFAFGAIIGTAVGAGEIVGYLAAALLAAALFGPVHRRVQRFLDQRYSRDREHYVEALEELSRRILLLGEMDELTEEVVDKTVATVEAAHGALLLSEPDGAEGEEGAKVGFVVVASTGEGAPPVGATWERAEAAESEEPNVTVPVSAPAGAGEPIGYLRLGPRRGGDLYSRRDRALLSALADQLGIALANGRAYERIAQMSRVLTEQNREIRDLRDKLEDENRYLKGRLGDHHRGEKVLTGSSKAIRELRKTLGRVAGSAAVVLLRGETGTGKSLVARALHEASPRAEEPFIHVDCGAIPAGVFESELFGHEKGAFTGAIRHRRGAFELADGGTLFLDEIGELPLELQPKLLRFFSEQTLTRVGGTREVEVDVRVVAATHRRLDEMVRRGEFREDLYYRLAVVEIDVPPLRQRRGDVRELAQALLPRLCRRNHIRERRLTDAAMERLEAYGWPGNVRELMNVLERAAVLSEGTTVDADDLALADQPPTAEELGASSPVQDDADHREVMETIERDRLIAALKASGGNRSSAARTLGIPRTTLINKIRRYGIEEG